MERLLYVTTDVNEAMHFVEGFTPEDFYYKRKPLNKYNSLGVNSLGAFSTRLGFEPMTIVEIKDPRFNAERIAIEMAKEGLLVATEDDEGEIHIYHSQREIKIREQILIEALCKMPSGISYRSSGREDIQASNILLLYSNSPGQIKDFK
jgi:hypothetical protein